MKSASGPDRDSSTSEMTFWDHLDALRGVLIRGAIVVMILTVGLFAVMPRIFDEFILAPCRPDFPLYRWIDAIASADLLGLGPDTLNPDFQVNLINTSLASQLMIHMSASFWLALVLSTPVLLILVWRFIAPALYRSERRAVSGCLIAGTAMFALGVATAYMVIFPLTVRFLATYQLSPLIPNMISIDSYMDTFTSLSLIIGLAFEMPPITWLAGRLGLLHRNMLSRFRRHSIVALLVAAALITPTGDPLTLAIVFAPLYLLWEVSILLLPKKEKE